jgi:hypothetical protein
MATTHLELDEKFSQAEHLEADRNEHGSAYNTEVNDLIHNPQNWCSWGFVYQCGSFAIQV